MKTISGKKFCKLLEEHGWILARINGSHFIYIKSGSDLRISIPVHKNDDLKIGLFKKLLKLTEISEDEL
ncbi:type II toxin-antitoxin system HicA family toxin [Brachyspira innocens]|uniref:Type II toxin-antitoxin system HicA family toxin n=1 Tax=Brachyspira innocens TaxID=13264 RepID=A0ABT8YUK6_9SPIR|nr:type II toxin-antitoxin system HicA family toxin [Brachyspira innocens]MDO6992960.1 type II toxin-antitoxin system HicA family toxin [Brachyspira innocens]MDO7019231.1 type II toxin-antitoxin system HicA family toxin [Brachyspira innocens]